MAFDDEWAGLRTDAAARMRLNGVPGGDGVPGLPGSSDADLKSSAAKKAAAITALEQHIQPDVQKAGSSMDEATEAAAKGFKEWATGAGIDGALKGWRASVKSLQARLSAEKAGLSGANRLFQGTDIHTGNQFPLLIPKDGQGVQPPFTSRLSGY
ncbi:hypothetical protein QZH56_08050 [Streptomyces olivoreticuli]|uniref:hypothetical protein n=1 Tax=Streptomyces olivoreticuli TaxID=68246 RepID=UPI002659A981|nr:hypothetical protein [Streptomyces olivoreticuli]WKK25538.1 hypothetical protein QZH56_08050 [Streptomyces olivoreticuli]